MAPANIITLQDEEKGVVCMDCDRPFRAGDYYAERLLGVIDGHAVAEVICMACNGAVTAQEITENNWYD